MIIIINFDKIKQYKNITSHKNLQYCVAQNRLQLSRWSRSHQSHPSSTNSGMIFPSSESTPRSVRTSEDLSRSLQPIIPLLHHSVNHTQICPNWRCKAQSTQKRRWINSSGFWFLSPWERPEHNSQFQVFNCKFCVEPIYIYIHVHA